MMCEEVRSRIASILNYPRLDLGQLAYVYYHCRNSSADDGNIAMGKFLHSTSIVQVNKELGSSGGRLFQLAVETADARCKDIVDLLKFYFDCEVASTADATYSVNFVDELLDSWLKTKGSASLERDGIFAITNLFGDRQHSLSLAVAFCRWDERTSEYSISDDLFPIQLVRESLARRGYLDVVGAIKSVIQNDKLNGANSETLSSLICNDKVIDEKMIVELLELLLCYPIQICYLLDLANVYCGWYVCGKLVELGGQRIVDAIRLQHQSLYHQMERNGRIAEWMDRHRERIELYVDILIDPPFDLPKDLAWLSIEYV
jgi:hypothetical protein